MQRLISQLSRLAMISVTLSSVGLSGQTMNVDHTSLRGARLYGSTDPIFLTTLDKHAASAHSTLPQGTLDNTVLISNGSLLTIVAYHLRWTTAGPDGKAITHDTQFSEPHVLMTHHTAGGHAIEPGSTRLVSPSFTIAEKNLSSALPQLAQQSAQLATQGGPKITGVKLDGVIFDDGIFSGPDESHFFEQFKASSNARHDSGIAVLRGIKEGLSDEDLLKKLKDQAARAKENLGQTPKDYYYAERSSDAGRLAMILERYGRNALLQNAKSMGSEQHYNLRKLTN